MSLLTANCLAYADESKPLAQARVETSETRMLVSNALREPLKVILAKAEDFAGRPILVEYGSSHDLQQKIMAGKKFDIAILVPEINQQLFRAGKIRPGAYGIARVPVAIGLRGVADLDVSTSASLKRAMLRARSIKYSPTGAAHATVKRLLAKLDIEGQIKDSSSLPDDVPLVVGEYELCLYPISEIIPNRKLRNLGPLPAELQNSVVVQAAIGREVSDLKMARGLIAFLQGSTIDGALKSYGMEKTTSTSDLN